MTKNDKPLIITGSSGNIGSALKKSLKHKYLVIGIDKNIRVSNDVTVDLTSQESVILAVKNLFYLFRTCDFILIYIKQFAFINTILIFG